MNEFRTVPKEDKRLIQRCIKADKQAWDEFIKRYSNLIYSYIWSVFKEKGIPVSSSLVDDLFQDIFLHLIEDNFKRLSQYKGNCSFSGWLKVVVINFILDFLRKRQIPHVSLEENINDTEGLTLEDTLKDDKQVPQDEIFLDNEMMESLSDCIKKLNSEERFFVEMHIYRGISLERLKTILRISRSAIDMRKQRIIQRLKNCFRSKGFLLET
jgi:RNA polymerase sigma factor (sigma-70 family)